jgi:PHD/YefM family antitoxin component YafN of YafNO toxin-antitoxin module
MTTKNKIKASETSLNQIFNQVVESNEPLVVDTEEQSFVVVTEEQWNSLQESLYLQSIPSYVDKFYESLNSPPESWVDAKDIDLI